MHLTVWAAFAVTAFLIGIFPGPGVTSIVGYALSSGRRTALLSVAGLACGTVIATSLSLAGVGAILRASSLAFMVLKWAGAAYLIGLGLVTLWSTRGGVSGVELKPAPAISGRTAFLSNLALGSFHPKTIAFFVAFAPQFMDPKAAYLPQAAILVATFTAVIATTDSCYALVAAQAATFLRRPRTLLWSKRAGGGVLIAAGVATAAAKA
jgi:threonine/homoserine/homoserine lactone efflux protein